MRYVLALMVLLVSACSGGGGGDVVDPIDELPKVIEPEPDPAPTGTAAYRGPTSLSFTPVLATTVNLSGTMSLDVNFDNAAVTGSAAGFETASGGAVTGELFLSSGALTDIDVALLMASQISGSLRSGTDSYLISGQIAGEVLEDNQSAVAGTITGIAQQLGRNAPLSGSFQAGRVP